MSGTNGERGAKRTMPGRNDPCPCGSGKKYKKCCLRKDEARRASSQERIRAVARVLEWLFEHHGEAVVAAVEHDLLGHLTPDDRRALREAPQGLSETLSIYIHEWLITDAELMVEGRRVRAVDLALGPGGPLLTAEQRAWIETIAAEPMWLYEVVDVKRGEGVRIRDLLHGDAAPFWVVERSGSESLERWDVLGARVVEDQGQTVFSGAIYRFDPQEGVRCLEQIREALGENPARTREAGRVVLRVVMEAWSRMVLEVLDGVTVQLADVETGDPIVFVTDHYRVRDWEALEARLADRPDVGGDPKEGWAWLGGDPEDEMRRVRASLYRKGGNSLQVFARTLRRADEARAWLEELAGDLVEHRVRETADPMQAAARGGRGGAALEPLSPERAEVVRQQALRKVYEDWADQPIPALGDRTPWEAVRTPEGRKAVEALLRSYERREAEEARRTGKKPMDFGFLWEQVGLERPRPDEE